MMAITGGDRNTPQTSPPASDAQTTPETPAEDESAHTEEGVVADALARAFEDEADDLDQDFGEEENAKAESEVDVQAESDEEESATKPQTPPSTPPAPTDAVAEPAPTPQVPDQQPAPPPQQPAPEQQVQQPQAQPAPTVEELQQYYHQQREAALSQLANTQYALSNEEAEELGPEMAEFAPRLAARVFMDATAAAMQGVMQQLPGMFQHLQQAQTQNSTHEQNFFARWPGLSKPEYRNTLMAFAQTYRQVNPQATPEQFINDVGAQVSVALQVPVPGTEEEAEPTPAPPFQPASAAPAPKRSAGPENPFTALDREFEEEDLDLD